MEGKIKPTYQYVKKESIIQTVKRFIPKQFVPTNKMATILGIIFLAVIILALVQFPFDKLLAGNPNVVVKIGYPYSFLELGIMSPAKSPLLIKNSIIDLVIYLLISYILDVFISFITSIELIKSDEEKKEVPEVFKLGNPSMADRLTKKIFTK